MPDLRRTRKNLKTALAVIAGVDLLALMVYLSPLVELGEHTAAGNEPASNQSIPRTRLVGAARIFRRRVIMASHEITDSTEDASLPKSRRLDESANSRGPMDRDRTSKIQGGKKQTPAAGWNWWRWKQVWATTHTLAKFINALERDEMFSSSTA